MVAWVEARGEVATALLAGTRAKGEYRCSGCGYGVTVYSVLPRCPMCGAGDGWEQLDWSPFGRAGSPQERDLPS